MIVTPDIIKANPDKLFIIEVAYHARPQHCRRDQDIGYYLPNTYPLYTKWWCCEDDRSFFKDYEFEQLIRPLWEKQVREIAQEMKDGEFQHCILSDDFGIEWSRLDKLAPMAQAWLATALMTLHMGPR